MKDGQATERERVDPELLAEMLRELVEGEPAAGEAKPRWSDAFCASGKPACL